MTTTMKRACLAAVAGVLLIAAVVLLMILLPGNTAAASDDAGVQTSVEADAQARARQRLLKETSRESEMLFSILGMLSELQSRTIGCLLSTLILMPTSWMEEIHPITPS